MTYINTYDYGLNGGERRELERTLDPATVRSYIDRARDEIARRKQSIIEIEDYIRIAQDEILPRVEQIPTLTYVALEREKDEHVSYHVYTVTLRLTCPNGVWGNRFSPGASYVEQESYSGQERREAMFRARYLAEDLECLVQVYDSFGKVPEKIIPLAMRKALRKDYTDQEATAYAQVLYEWARDNVIADHIDETLEREKHDEIARQEPA